MLVPLRRIELRPQEDSFLVEILPPFTDGANFDRLHTSYKAARGYAGGLRMCLGLRLHDDCGEPDG